MGDTSKKLAEMTHKQIMALSGQERMTMAVQMSQVMRAEILASFPPGLSEIEIKRRLCERLYGDEVDVDAFIESFRSRPQTSGEEQSSRQE